MEGFGWDRIGFCFPEWGRDRETGERQPWWEDFTDPPTFENGCIRFLWNGDYGVQAFISSVPPWLMERNVHVGKRSLGDFYRELSEEVYSQILGDLDGASDIFESWREKGLIKRYGGDMWKGRIQDHLDFRKFSCKVTLGDYYTLDKGRDGSGISPSDKILAIGNLPRDSLNEKWSRYAGLVDYVRKRPTPQECPSIVGATITECVSRANEIYSIADELFDLSV